MQGHKGCRSYLLNNGSVCGGEEVVEDQLDLEHLAVQICTLKGRMALIPEGEMAFWRFAHEGAVNDRAFFLVACGVLIWTQHFLGGFSGQLTCYDDHMAIIHVLKQGIGG